MPIFKKCPDEVQAMALEILNEFPSHAPLVTAGLKIDFVFALADVDDHGNAIGPALKLNGRQALGIARKIKLKDRVLGRGDCEVSLDGDWWARSSAAEQRALLDHELHHFIVEMDGERVITDDIGRPKLRMRRHDFEFGWFEMIASRHGKASQEVQQARLMMQASGTILLQTSFDFNDLPERVEPLREMAESLQSSGVTLTLSSGGSEVVIDSAAAKRIIKSCDKILAKSDCDEDEDLIQQCIEVIRSEQKASVSLLQRRLRLGYTRSARIMDELERRGIVGPAKGAELRDILVEAEAKA